MHDRHHDSHARCFFLAEPPQAGRARLVEEDEEHATRVLRLEPGAEIVGFDGFGGRWPLRVLAARRGALVLETTGEPEREPQPGSAEAPLPWIEVAVAFPKGGRADEMLDRLVQLGAAAVVPILAARSQSYDAERVEQRSGRWSRIARSACKQSRRAWLPNVAAPHTVAALLGARAASAELLLQPGAPVRLAERLAGAPWGSREAPLRLWVGPEGGWTSEEESDFEQGGAWAGALAPYVLRVETAAEAALAVAVQTLWRR